MIRTAWYVLGILIGASWGDALGDITEATRENAALQPMENAGFGSSIASFDSLIRGFAVGEERASNSEGVATGAVTVPVEAVDILGNPTRRDVRLSPEDGSEGARFGASVASAGDWLVVGAPEQDGKGAVYIYRLGFFGPPELEVKLVAPDAMVGDEFGCSVSMTTDFIDVPFELDPVTLVVGARGKNDRGAAYVFERSQGNAWFLTQKLERKGGKAGDLYGSSVSVSGLRNQVLVVGAPGVDIEDREDQGAVYVYERSNLTSLFPWTNTETLLAPDGTANEHYGHAVSVLEASESFFFEELGSRLLLVGAPSTGGDPLQRGRALVYEGEFSEPTELRAPAGYPYLFGHAVDLTDEQVIVGAPGVGDEMGRAELYRREFATDLWRRQCTLSDSEAGPLFGATVALGDGVAAVGSPIDDFTASGEFGRVSATRAGKVYYYEPLLIMTLDQLSISENGGFTDGSVSRNLGVIGELEVDMVFDKNKVIVSPASFVIPDGESSIPFRVTGVNNDGALAEDPSTTIRASAFGYRAAELDVTVTDDDRVLILSVPSDIDEDGFGEGTVARNTGTEGDLVVTLNNSLISRVSVPATVTIPDGFESVSFVITGTDDAVVGVNQSAEFIASAPAFQDGADSIELIENDHSVAGRVWRDLNSDGIRSGGEPAKVDVRVRLFDGGGDLVAPPTFSESDGLYAFTGLVASEYTVVFDVPSGLDVTLQDQGVNESVDSDIDALGRVGVVVAIGTQTDAVDAGFLVPAPVAFYRLDELEGPIATDSGEGGRHGEYVPDDNDNFDYDVSGLHSSSASAVRFIEDAEVIVHGDLFEPFESFTYSLWIEVDDDGEFVQTLIASTDIEGNSDSIHGLVVIGNALGWLSGGEFSVVTEAAIEFDTSHHVVVRFDGGDERLSIFVDNVERVSGPVEAVPSESQGLFFLGGLGLDADFFDGTMDDVQIYDVPLDEPAITSLFLMPGEAASQVVKDAILHPRLLMGEGHIDLEFDGQHDTTYTLEYSKDLNAWMPIASDRGTLRFEDSDGERISRADGYYRIVKP